MRKKKKRNYSTKEKKKKNKEDIDTLKIATSFYKHDFFFFLTLMDGRRNRSSAPIEISLLVSLARPEEFSLLGHHAWWKIT